MPFRSRTFTPTGVGTPGTSVTDEKSGPGGIGSRSACPNAGLEAKSAAASANAALRRGACERSGDATRGIKAERPEGLGMTLRQTRGEPYHPRSMPSRKRAATTSSGRKQGAPPPRKKIPVGVLGGTGTVGQRFVQLLEGHPWFEIVEVLASDQSAGKPYAEAVGSRWKLTTPIPAGVAKLRVRAPGDKLQGRVLFSALDASVAGELEREYASRGHFVSSNARNHRMDPKVPLAIPEVNRDHMKLLDLQPYKNGGGLVTNPNCSTIVVAMSLAPLHRAYGVDAAIVTTFQAVSGAGYPGVPSLDILGNVVPFISGEEEKMQSETHKILARLGAKGIAHSPCPLG